MNNRKRTARLRLDHEPLSARISKLSIDFCDSCGLHAVGYRQWHDKHACTLWPHCAWQSRPPASGITPFGRQKQERRGPQ